MESLNLNTMALTGTASALQYDPFDHAKMKADTVNKTTGGLDGYDCTKCLNRGMIAYPREDGTIYTKECSCMKIRRCVWEMERSGLKNVIREKTFEAFTTPEEWQKDLKSKTMEFADKLSGWLLCCGQPGSGKTHLCTAVCRQRLLAGDEVRYMPWRDKIAELKSVSLDGERREAVFKPFKTAQILYIDDLFKTGKGVDGSCGPTRADIDVAFEIIDHRERNNLITIISTEKTKNELLDIDEALGSRILDKARGYVLEVNRNRKKNYRLRGATAD